VTMPVRHAHAAISPLLRTVSLVGMFYPLVVLAVLWQDRPSPYEMGERA
jgi:hypothetical protein